MWEVNHRKSVVSPAPCERRYLKMATDGSAGIEWHLRMETFWFAANNATSWSFCASVHVHNSYFSVRNSVHIHKLIKVLICFFLNIYIYVDYATVVYVSLCVCA